MVDLSALEALPENGPGVRAIKFSAEEDSAILKYWPTKNHVALAKAMGHCTNTLLRRYRELTD